MKKQSIRSQLVAKRTYNRPLDEHGTVFETWEQTVNRVIEHQRWLWERAKGHNTNEDLVELTPAEEHELEELRELLLNYDVAVSGRTFWLGGTPISKEYEATQFNCAGVVNATVHDIVDSFHLLLLGCFSENTEIITKSGNKKISDVSVLDEVLSYNELTNQYVWKYPIFSGNTNSKEINKLELVFSDNSIIKCTEDHLFLTKNRGWVEAKNLNEKDDLRFYE